MRPHVYILFTSLELKLRKKYSCGWLMVYYIYRLDGAGISALNACISGTVTDRSIQCMTKIVDIGISLQMRLLSNPKTSPGGIYRSQLVANGLKWSEKVSNGLKRSQKVANGLKWSQKVPKGPKRSQMVPKGLKWFQKVPKGLKRSQMV